MTTFLHIAPWLVIALPIGWMIYFFVDTARFGKLCRQRTAAYNAAIEARNRGDMEEFDFLYAEWKRLADECERRMGGKKKADATNPFRSTPL